MKRTRLLLIPLLMLLAQLGFSQAVTNYTFASSSGTFTALSGGTTQALTAGNTDDGNFDGLPLGFDFWYMGTRYTSVSASTNGWATLGAPITNATYLNSLTNSGAPRPVIAPLWDDLEIVANTNLSYATSGSAPSRVFTLQWLNCKWNYVATAAGISFQLKLYESTGKIEFVYRPESGALNAASASIGIAATAVGSGNFRSLNGAGNNPSVSSTTETTTIAAKPSSGRIYAFTPPVPTAPTSLVFSSIGATSMTLGWTDNASNEIGYVIYRSTDGVTYTFDTQTAANVSTSAETGLSPNVTYYWKVYAVSEGGLSTALSGTQATICTAPNLSQTPLTSIIGNYRFRGNATDLSGTNHGTLQGNPTLVASRFGTANHAYTYNGTSQYVSTANLYNNPTDFTISVWFKTSTTTGGKLLGFGGSQTGASTNYDRHLYMNNAGQIYFGVYPGVVKTINSAAAYNDNAWHLATATMSSTAGMILYMDGAQVASDPATTTVQNYTGYWRFGYDNVNGWTSQPTSFYFSGILDDALIYHRALSPSEVTTIYSNPDGATSNSPVCTGSSLNLSATTVASTTYAWSGPNGFTSSSQNPSLTFSAPYAGVYSVTATLAGCPVTAYTIVTASTTTGQWTGNTSTDWATASNWCAGAVPTASTDVTIPAGATNMPSISSSVDCKNLTIAAGATLTTTSGGTLNIAGTLANSGTMTNSGTTNFNGTSGQQTFSGVTAFYNLILNNASGLLLPNAITVANDITLTAGTLNAGNYNISVAGDWFNNVSTAAFTAGTGTVTMNGTIAQTLGGSFATTFNHLTISNTGNTVSLAANASIAGNLTVSSGTLDISTFTANRTTAGGVLLVNNNATLKIGGTNTFPSNYTTKTLAVASTVEYAGTNQTVANEAYGNLTLSSSSGAAVKTFPASAMVIAGNLTSTLGAGTSVSYTAAAGITVNGNINIGASTTFNGGSYTHSLGGNWVNAGTFTGSTSTLSMFGTTTSISGTGTHNFNNLTITAPFITIAASSNITVAGNLATTGTGDLTHAAGGTLTMSGSSKTISGTGIVFANLTVSGSVTSATSFKIAGDLSISGSLATSAGVIDMCGTSKSISGAGTITLNSLLASGSISCTANFSISSSLSVSGSITATAGTTTFTSVSSLSGTANLYNVTLNCTTTELGNNSQLGIANVLTITAGTLVVTSNNTNTVNFNGTGAQSVNGITYNNLILSGGNTKTAAAAIDVRRDLTIAASTTFNAASYSHQIKRNWNNNGTFTAGTSTVTLSGTENGLITGATTFNVLTIDKALSTGSVTLASNISVPTLNMTLGTLFTYANTVTITNTRTGSGVIMGNIQRTHSFSTSVAYAFESPENTITFASVSGVSSVTVSVATGSIGDFPFGGSISREYDITVPSGTYNATLRLHYEDAELNGNTESSMALWHYNGTTWATSGNTGNNVTSNYVEQSGLTDITDRWTCSDNSNVVRWNGSVSTAWNTAANWTTVQGSPSLPPSATDIVNLGTAAFTNQPTITTAVTVKNITFGSTQAVTLTLGSGGSLTTGDINGNWSANRTHTLDVGAQTLTVNGEFQLSDSTTGHAIDLNIGTGSVSVEGNLTQNGGANITFSGAGTLSLADHFHYISGTFTPGSGTVVYDGSNNQHVGIVPYFNLTIDNSAGIVSIQDTLLIAGDLLVTTGDLDNFSVTTIEGDVTIASAGTFDNWNKLFVGGDWLNNGTFEDNGGLTTFNGTGAQSISPSEFGDMDIDKPSGTATITGDMTISGNFTITSGTFDFQTYFIYRSVLGGYASIANGATAIIGGNNGPNGFSSYALDPTSTVIFNGTATQYIAFEGLDFGHVIFRNGGANGKILVSDASILGDLTIENTAMFMGTTYSITLQGNWTNNGTFVPMSSTVILTGTSKSITGATAFNAGTVTGSYTIANDISFDSLLLITPTGAMSAASGNIITLHGDLLNAGYVYTLGTVIMTGNQAQTMSLINATTVALFVQFNGTVPPTLFSTSSPQFGYLTISNTGGVSPSVGWTVLYGMTVSSGAAFHGGTSSHNILGSLTNNGTITSSGALNFVPSTAKTVNMGTDFTSTGTVVFGGTGALTLAGSPNSMHDVTVSNTHTSGIASSSDWLVTNDLTINAGATLHAGSRNYTIGGDFYNNGTWDAGTSVVTLNGTSTQELSNDQAFYDLVLNKASGQVTQLKNARVNHNLNFLAGRIATSSFDLYLPAAATVTGAAANTGWVIGNLRKYVATGATNITFELGDASYYTPTALAFTNVTTAGDLTCKVTAGDHPQIATSDINPTKSLNRYWTVTNGGVVSTIYNATFNYVSGDIDAGATAADFEVGHNDGSSWDYHTPSTATTTQTIVAGCNDFGDLVIGEICNKGTAIDYVDSTYCGNAGTALVTRTGTSGGTFASSSGLDLDPSTGTVTLATSTSGTYNVTYTVAAAGGCPIFTATDNIIVTDPPIAAFDYPLSPYCFSAGEITPVFTGTSGGTFTSAVGLTLQPTYGTVDAGSSTPGTYTVTYTIAAAGGCAAFDTTAGITISTPPNFVPYYNLIGQYKFEETALDAEGQNDGTLQNAPVSVADRFAVANHAYSFDGTSQYVSTANAFFNPYDFSLSVWFKTTTGSGGRLVGLGSSQTGSSANADRHIYMNNAGQIYFGVNPGTPTTIHSPSSYNDGNWHNATATLSSANGMVLYIDGVSVANDPSTTAGMSYSGYWKIGFDALTGWPSQPSSNYFSGILDDVTIYDRSLSADEAVIMANALDGATSNAPICTGSTLQLDVTSVSGATYLWSGPNGFSSTTQNPSFVYAPADAGVYIAQVNSGGCLSTVFTHVSGTSTPGLWTGAVSTDWATVGNWCSGALPTSTVDVLIPNDAPRMPIIGGTADCQGLTLETGTSLTTNLTGTLQVTGDIANAGTMTNNGTTHFLGISGTQNFSGITAFHHLILENAAGLLLPNSITVSGDLTIVNGTLTSTNDTIFLQGDWDNQDVFDAGTGAVVLTASNSQTVASTGTGAFYDLVIDKSASNAALLDDVGVDHVLRLTAGFLDLNTHTLSILSSDSAAIIRAAGYLLSEQTDNSSMVAWTIDAAAGNHEIPFGAITGNYIPVRVKVTSGNAGTVKVSTYPTNNANLPYPVIPTLVTNILNDQGLDNSANAVDRFWEVNTTNPSGVMTLTFTAQLSEVGSIGNLIAQRWDSLSETWDEPLPGQSRSGTSVTVPSVNEFTSWALTGNNAPFPVEFLDFEAFPVGEIVKVKWSTAMETNSANFAVERSLDGINFETAKVIPAAGNSHTLIRYNTEDLYPYPGRSYYRVTEYDRDGGMTRTQMVEVNFGNTAAISFLAFPNPTTQDDLWLAIQGAASETVAIQLVDLAGNVHAEEEVAVDSNAFTHHILIGHPLTRGLYVLRADCKDFHYSARILLK